MFKLDVLVMLGRSGRAEKFPLKQQSSWEWRFVDGGTERVFVVTFDEEARSSHRRSKKTLGVQGSLTTG